MIRMKFERTFQPRAWIIGCVLFTFAKAGISQDFNSDFTTSFINHSTPKSPESASFEKYGSIPVSEYTGVPSISIPLISIKGSSLQTPVSLSYHASGIKVNQDATWVGLGWDIVAGGRITLDIKGGYDKYTKQYLQPSMKSSMAWIFEHFPLNSIYSSGVNAPEDCNWGPSHPGWPNNPPSCVLPDSMVDATYWEDVENIMKKGIAEPDLFHVSFMGNSFSFYRDLFTDSIKFQGDENLFSIEETTYSTYGSYFTITDNNGIKYFFEEEEKSYYLPNLEGIIPSITTAWLLTQVIHPNGDYMQFAYSNFGSVYPAPSISETESYDTAYKNFTTNINGWQYGGQVIYQEPRYLTSIQSKNTLVEFHLSTRTDIAGGARKLDKITVSSKLNSEVFQQIKFNYDYFSGSSGHIYFDTTTIQYGTSGPGNYVIDHLSLRLKLLSIDKYGTDSTQAETHKFFYNGTALPNKASISQDHWGLYNGKNLSAPSMSSPNFTPSISSLVAEGIMHTAQVSLLSGNDPPSTISPNLTQILPGRINRQADETYAKAFILDSIVYPTGGSTSFKFELHRSYYSPTSLTNFIGGGLRIKRMMDYPVYGAKATQTDYLYEKTDSTSSGIYRGAISYVKATNRWFQLPNPPPNPDYIKYVPLITLFSNGNLIDGGSAVVYSRVIKLVNGGAEGKIIKNFFVRNPIEPQSTGNFPIVERCLYIPPTPERETEGTLQSEKFYDNVNTLRKSIDHHYSQVNITNKMYNLKIVQRAYLNPALGAGAIGGVMFIYEPVKSYYILKDSTVESSYEPTGTIVAKNKLLYNNFFQPEYVVTSNSKGEQSIIYTKTPLTYNDVPQGESSLQGNASAISYMRANHIYDNPVEKILLKRGIAGDTSVLRGIYNVYDVIGNVKQSYLMETDSPVPISQFQRSVYSGPGGGYSIVTDSKYKINQSAVYQGVPLDYGTAGTFPSGPYIKELISSEKPMSFIYDTLSNTMLAACDGALQADIAYTSFELSHPDNWSYTGSTSADVSAPTGSKCYQVGQSGGSITCTGLNQNKEYILSYWTKNTNAYSVTGTINGSIKQGASLQAWNYFQQRISGQSSILITGSGFIDELRLYPADAQMKTFTYDPFFRMIAESDASGKIMYYEYDASGRLKVIRDQFKNIVKKLQYKFAEQKVNFDGQNYLNHAHSQAFTKNNCSAGSPQIVVYSVPEGKYSSTNSQADADQLAVNDIAANGQSYANSNGFCVFYNTLQSSNFTQNNCSPGYLGSTITYSVPAGKYMSFVSQNDANQQALNEISANGQALANQGTCLQAITISCTSSVPEPISLELTNNATSQTYYFTIYDYGTIGEIPIGTYSVRLNPQSYSQAYTYIINDTYYQSGELVATFENISFTDSNSSTIYIY